LRPSLADDYLQPRLNLFAAAPELLMKQLLHGPEKTPNLSLLFIDLLPSLVELRFAAFAARCLPFGVHVFARQSGTATSLSAYRPHRIDHSR